MGEDDEAPDPQAQDNSPEAVSDRQWFGGDQQQGSWGASYYGGPGTT